MTKKPTNEKIELVNSKTNSIKLFSFSSNEVPQYGERINNNLKCIEWGCDSDPIYLNMLSLKCASHSAIIKTKANMIGGQGWQKAGLSPQAISFLKNKANKLNLDKILKLVSHDYEQLGAFALELIWSKDRKSIAEINYIHPYNLKVVPAEQIIDSEYPDRDGWLLADNWDKRYLTKHPPVFYWGFDEDDRENESQILYVKQNQGSIGYYGIPSWIGCKVWCEIDYKLGDWHLHNIDNGMTPNLLINFNSLPPDEEQDEVVRRTKTQYNGVKGEKTIITFSDGKENAPNILPINLNQNEQAFKDLMEISEGKIFKGHQVNNPVLFGVLVPGQIGGTNQLLESLSMFQANYIVHKQLDIQNVFNEIAEINGIQDRLFVEKYNLNLEVSLDAKSILLVLESTVQNNQKIETFIALGYTREQALLLCPMVAPQPVAPIKIPQVQA